MSTVSGGIVPINFSNASASSLAFTTAFASVSQINAISASGVSTLTGGDVITSANGSYTLSASVIDDASSGGNSITTINPSIIFAQSGDTISSAAATTILGAQSGTTTFALSGANSSVTGGSGSIVGTASGANTTLIGGTGTANAFTLSGSNSLAVAGQSPGVTHVTLDETSGGSEITTNPLGNSGTLIATLSASGADSVIGGGGVSTITGGGGADVFGFVKGHAGGTETILNFTSSDTFAFGGYGYSLSNLPTEVVTGGNDVITLSDNTVITLVGIDHKVF
jgi:hypothetical protein